MLGDIDKGATGRNAKARLTARTMESCLPFTQRDRRTSR